MKEELELKFTEDLNKSLTGKIFDNKEIVRILGSSFIFNIAPHLGITNFNIKSSKLDILNILSYTISTEERKIVEVIISLDDNFKVLDIQSSLFEKN